MIWEKEDFFTFQDDVFLSHPCMISVETSESCSLLDLCLFYTHTHVLLYKERKRRGERTAAIITPAGFIIGFAVQTLNHMGVDGLLFNGLNEGYLWKL